MAALVKSGKAEDAFMAWAEAEKPCKYCGKKFIGPVCCEL